MSFKEFLINEEQSFLGSRIGDVTTAVQDLQSDLGGMGLRQKNRIAEDIVKQIRRILHGRWTPRQERHLKEIQKIGVALMKCIDEKGDLDQLLPNITKQLQNISGKLGVKVNNLEAPEMEETPQNVTGQQMNMHQTGDGPMPPSQDAATPPQNPPIPSSPQPPNIPPLSQ